MRRFGGARHGGYPGAAAIDKQLGYSTPIDDHPAVGIEFGLPIDGEEDPRSYDEGQIIPGPTHIDIYNGSHRMAREAIDRCRGRDDYGAEAGFVFDLSDLEDDAPDAGQAEDALDDDRARDDADDGGAEIADHRQDGGRQGVAGKAGRAGRRHAAQGRPPGAGRRPGRIGRQGRRA